MKFFIFLLIKYLVFTSPLTCKQKETHRIILHLGHETSKNPSYEVFNKNPKPLPRSQALEPTSRASLQGTLKSQINYNCCEECGSSDSNTELLLCNKFYHGFHLFCLTPLTVSVPKGSWLCPTNSNHKKLKFIFQGS